MKKTLKNNKQIVHKTTKTNYISLPNQLVNDIQELGISNTLQSHCYKFVGILLRDSFEQFSNLTSPTPKPQTYLIKAFDDKYHEWLNVLLNNKIVIRTEIASKVKHVCYNYHVNPIYFKFIPSLYNFNSIISNPSILCREKECEVLLTVPYKDIIKTTSIDERKHLKWFEDDISTLNIDYSKLETIVENKVKNLSISDFDLNENIHTDIVKISIPNGNEHYIPKADAIKIAKSRNEDLIKDGKRYVIADATKFIEEKKIAIGFSYLNSINRLRNGCYKSKRNLTNNRLDTNLTNMYSELVNEICIQNNLVQIDLKNSQFAILSYVLKQELNSSHFKLFKTLSISGQLYAFIADKLSLKTKKEGKISMFEIMFSSRKNNTSGKKRIRELFPTIISWIDSYKLQHGDNKFSIMLQKKESEIFIDLILNKIKSKKFFCLTKHDSVIVHEKDYLEIHKIIQECFDKIGMEGELHIIKPADLIMIREDKKDLIKANEIAVKNEVIEINYKKERLRERYLSRFKYASPNYNLSPAEFHILTSDVFLDLVSLTQVYKISKELRKSDFENFWITVQDLKSIIKEDFKSA